jgi:hypothetical protein
MSFTAIINLLHIRACSIRDRSGRETNNGLLIDNANGQVVFSRIEFLDQPAQDFVGDRSRLASTCAVCCSLIVCTFLGLFEIMEHLPPINRRRAGRITKGISCILQPVSRQWIALTSLDHAPDMD